MMYINRIATTAPETMKNATPATPVEIAAFEKECYDRCGQYSNYVPAFTVIDGNIVFYADGPWEC